MEPADVTPQQEPAPEQAQQALTAEQEEEARLRAKYGGAVPKKKGHGLLPVGRKADPTYFDSADWALSKQGAPKPHAPLAPTPMAKSAAAAEAAAHAAAPR